LAELRKYQAHGWQALDAGKAGTIFPKCTYFHTTWQADIEVRLSRPAAAVGTIKHILPIFCPFLTPIERLCAGSAYF
jgi:hypothetical protein